MNKNLIPFDQLSTGQLEALNAFQIFLSDPNETIFVLSGNAGCGKSTLVANIIDSLPKFTKATKLIFPEYVEKTLQLSATTNKAAENLYNLTGKDVVTIHSFIGLKVFVDYKSGETKLVPRSKEVKENYLLFVDEYSYIDTALLSYITKFTKNCKIVFIGDAEQLLNVGSSSSPICNASHNFSGYRLTEVVRQGPNNPITDLALKFRDTVLTGKFFSFKPDGKYIQKLNKEDFLKELLKEFSSPDWSYNKSKVLTWTNKKSVEYNEFIKEHISGDRIFNKGDYAICNNHVSISRDVIKASSMIFIEEVSPICTVNDVIGRYYTINSIKLFMPNSLDEKNKAITNARKQYNYSLANEMESQWIDLRAVYSCTINKAQGSTYDTVFIDLDDICKCNSGNQIARMLYVATSRPRHRIVFTGDLVG